MRDLTLHDKSPSTFLVYLFLYASTIGGGKKSIRLSLQMISEDTGLSKSSVQIAIRKLARRRLLSVRKASATAVPEYSVHRPWDRAKKTV